MASTIQAENEPKITPLQNGWLIIETPNYILSPRRAGYLGLVPEDASRSFLARLAANQTNLMRAIKLGDDPVLDAAAANFAAWLEQQFEEKAERDESRFRIEVQTMPMDKVVDLTILTLRKRGWDVVVPGRSRTGKGKVNSGAFYLRVA